MEKTKTNMTNKLCELCEESGIIVSEDGTKDYCSCEEGKKKEMLDEVLSDDEFGGTTVGDVLAMVEHND
jgi:hypothetical protein